MTCHGRLLAVTAAALLLICSAAVRAQPPVARPQPPPAAPAAKAPAPAPPEAGGAAPPRATVPAARPQDVAAELEPPSDAAAGQDVAPPPESLNAPVYPSAAYLGSYDAGRGQRFFLYGTTQAFEDIVLYYRGVLKGRGDRVFDEPATHMFDVGKYREADVAFPPSVTIKNYAFGGSPGLPNPVPGAQPPYFPTVIQIVTPPPAAAGRRVP